MVALVEAAMEVALMEALTEIKRLRRRTCSFASEYQPFAIKSDPRRKMRVYLMFYTQLFN